VFDTWNCTLPEFPPRSRLYALEPIGSGTALVESLTSYITRLADAHSVSVGDLVRGELSVSSPYSPLPFVYSQQQGIVSTRGFQNATYAINGLNESSKKWVDALERGTLRTNLRRLTLLPLQEVFAPRAALRETRAWCPACYEQRQRSGAVVYEPLLWTIRWVTVCPCHRQPLLEICPYCHRQLKILTMHSRSGCCSRCQMWLGGNFKRQNGSSESPSRTDAPDTALFQANTIGELLRIGMHQNGPSLGQIYAANLRVCVDTVAEGNLPAFARAVHVSTATIAGQLARKSLPSMSTLWQICRHLDVPLTAFLESKPGSVADYWEHAKTVVRRSWNIPPCRTPEQVRHALEQAVCEQPPPRLTEVARRLNYKDADLLYKVDRNLCKRISAKYLRSDRGYWWAKRDAARICGRAAIRAMLEQSLAQNHPVSVYQIAADIGYANDSGIRQQFPELCRAIRNKIAAERRSRLSTAELTLELAVHEHPVPAWPDLCKRVGYSRSALGRRFPVLYKQIAARHRELRDQQTAEIRETLQAALVESPPPSLASMCRRVGHAPKFLLENCAEECKGLRLRYRRHRKETSQRRREELKEEVRKIVQKLWLQGMHPTLVRVLPFLSKTRLKDWRALAAAVKTARHAFHPE
jgi:transcriptional regulator with XRE-family HTH domain